MSASSHGDHKGSPFIQHHYDNAKHQFDSGKLAIWLFLGQEVLFFSALFVAYVILRAQHPEVFDYASHYLDTKMGAINTVVLIGSSFTAAYAVRCAQLRQQRALVICLGITLLCAMAFLTIKYFEYSSKVHHGTLFGAKFVPVDDPHGTEFPTDAPV
ncbi:MAG: cytochrome c oxidase subunit 3, partial [Myxococcota bacterium]